METAEMGRGEGVLIRKLTKITQATTQLSVTVWSEIVGWEGESGFVVFAPILLVVLRGTVFACLKRTESLLDFSQWWHQAFSLFLTKITQHSIYTVDKGFKRYVFFWSVATFPDLYISLT